jgi:ferric-dicitrate binding protein FerR (iron transport regulator)
MDEVILAALQNRISATDLERLNAYRKESAANEAHYQQLAEIWNASAGSDPFAVSISAPPPELLEVIRSARPQRHETRAPRQSRRSRWIIPGLAAASGIAATFAFMSLGGLGQPAATNAVALGAAEFVTDTLETATARLEDGSVVRLAPRSRLRVSAGRKEREVWLDGEGYFAVAHDSKRPFRVRTRAGNVEVLGTRFDARVEGSELRVVVTEGVVALTAGTHRVLVRAGNVATVGEDRIPNVTAVSNPEGLLEWMDNALIFQNTPMRDVARELEFRYGIRVLLPDTAVASRRVTAWFSQQDAAHVIAAVCLAVEAHCTFTNGVASIEP